MTTSQHHLSSHVDIVVRLDAVGEGKNINALVHEKYIKFKI